MATEGRLVDVLKGDERGVEYRSRNKGDQE